MTFLATFVLPAFAAGLLFGSFLNVCIWRLPRGLSIVKPRSYCPACGNPVRWYDNVPLLGWLLLRGRCRDCKTAIPVRYPLVELATGLWFSAVALRCLTASLVGLHVPLSGEQYASLVLTGLSLAALGFLLIGLIVMDWQTQLLPDAFTWTGIAIALFLLCTQAIFLGPNEDQVLLTNHHIHLTSPGATADPGNVFLTGPERLLGGRLLAIAAVALLLLAIRWTYKAARHREGMGLGDVKMMAMMAAFLGFWPAILALFLGVLLATGYAVVLLATRRANGLTRLAFGSFLGAGGLISALFGDRLIESYARLLQ